MPKIGAIIEARMASKRLPGKVLTELLPGWPMIDVIVHRAQSAKCLSNVIVATTVNSADDSLFKHCKNNKVSVFRGSETDVMGRSLAAAKEFHFDWLVRLTGDNPLIEGQLIDDLVAFCIENSLDYAATTMMGHSDNWKAEREFPRGISVEIVRVKVLEAVAKETRGSPLREFTTFAVYDEPERWSIGAFPATGRYAEWKHPHLRFTVDTTEDLELVRHLFGNLSPNNPNNLETGEAIKLVAATPTLAAINASVSHNVVSKLKN